jgi:hypothetical protein
VALTQYPRLESNNPKKTLGIPKNLTEALQNALHFLPGLDQLSPELTNVLAAMIAALPSAAQQKRPK